jgi:2'-5' RNA ligase
MSLSRIFVDFHNADEHGRLRLNCIGTIEDLAYQQIELENGQRLTLYSEDLEIDGIVQFSEEEKIWVAVIDWNQIRQAEQLAVHSQN